MDGFFAPALALYLRTFMALGFGDLPSVETTPKETREALLVRALEVACEACSWSDSLVFTVSPSCKPAANQEIKHNILPTAHYTTTVLVIV